MALSISAIATMQTIEGIRDAVLDGLRIDDAVELDCSAILEADLSLLQLLHSARKFADREAKSLQVTGPISPALASLVQRAGFPGDADAAWDAFWQAGATEQ